MDQIAILFGGVVVSLVVQFTKKKLELNAFGTMMLVIALSIVGGVMYKILLAYGLWDTFVGVLVSAGAFYSFIIKNIKDISDASNDTASYE